MNARKQPKRAIPKQILTIRGYKIEIQSSPAPRRHSTVIHLHGTHSPSSSILTADVVFADEARLRDPTYDARRNHATLYLPTSTLAAVLSTIESSFTHGWQLDFVYREDVGGQPYLYADLNGAYRYQRKRGQG